MSAQKKVSIIIPAYNREEILMECLESVHSILYDNYEVLVVDDNSENPIAGYIRPRFNKAIVIRNNKRKGPAYCKNKGILKSAGELLWFLDSDSLIQNKDCLSSMVSILSKEPKIGCIGGELLCEGSEYLVRQDGRKIIFNQATEHLFRLKRVNSLTTANLLTRKELLRRIGGFDNNYFYMSEDTDICFKIRSLGYEIVLDASSLILHRYSPDSRQSNLFLFFRNGIRCALINSGAVRAFLIEPFSLLKNIIRTLGDKIGSKKRLSETTHMIALDSRDTGRAGFLLIAALKAIPAFIAAYFWNIIFSYKTVFIDKKINYLEETVAASL